MEGDQNCAKALKQENEEEEYQDLDVMLKDLQAASSG